MSCTCMKFGNAQQNLHGKTEDLSWSGHAWVLSGYVPYVPCSQGMAHTLAIPMQEWPDQDIYMSSVLQC